MTTLQLTPAGQYGVTLATEAIASRDAILTEARKVTAIADDLDLELASDTARQLKGLVKDTEKTRKLVKDPVLDLCRQVDATAAEYTRPAQDELTRIERLMTGYHAEQRRLAAEAEAQRQAELAQIEAAKRAAEEAATRAKAARLEAIEADRLAAERELLGQPVKQSELDLIEGQKAKAAADAEALRVQQEKLARAAQDAVSVPVIAPTRTAGMQVRTVWTFDILDIWQVPRDFVRIEPNREAILDAIRRGIRDIPGLRVWSESKTGVR